MGQLKALVATIEPIDGGVPSMTRWICKLLEEENIRPTLAWYAPWRNYPELSVPIYQTGRKTPGTTQKIAFRDYDSYGLGAWYPEFEFTHYLPRQAWVDLIKSHHLHFVVSGNTLAATPYFYFKVPYIAWIATPWEADRKNRIQAFGKKRRYLDAIVNKPILKYLERRILHSRLGTVLALSGYTSKEIQKISGRNVQDVMLMPIDTQTYYPNNEKTIPLRVGFSGRYCDPRKNIDLLFKACKILVDKGHALDIILVGDKDADLIKSKITAYGLESYVTCYQHMNPKDLSALLQTFDIFVIPSFQEGLCISALEAMACGVPVVSTRCGGPEEYVIPLETGLIVNSESESLASAVLQICMDRGLRAKLAKGSCNWVRENASEDSSRSIFKRHLYNLAKQNEVLLKSCQSY